MRISVFEYCCSRASARRASRSFRPMLSSVAACRSSAGGRRLEQGLLDQLLGDGGAALDHRPRQHVAEQGPGGALDVQAAVLVEARVLDVDQGLQHHRGDLLGRHGHPVVPVEPGDRRSVGRQDDGVAGRGLVAQHARQRGQQVRRGAHGQAGPHDPGQEEGRGQGAGERRAHDQQEAEGAQSRVLAARDIGHLAPWAGRPATIDPRRAGVAGRTTQPRVTHGPVPEKAADRGEIQP